MRDYFMSKIINLFLVLLIIFSSNCTIVGLAGGGIYDINTPDRELISEYEITSIKEGEKIDLVMKNGIVVTGEYCGLKRLPIKEYERKYNENYDDLIDEATLPKLRDSLIVTLSSGDDYEVKFMGFDFENYLIIDFNKKINSDRINIDYINKLEYLDGNPLYIIMIKKLMNEKRIPYVSEYCVSEGSHHITVNTADVREIKKDITTHYFATGAFLGLIVDATIVLYISGLLSQCIPH